ncbi:Rad52/Rad22 family DNA repair protein [Streptomyces sp. NBC_00669]|uniref:Rad52/Rad22 family DNA repair protein n=1 Tax=Streptomyces sp. NBC_00669 TaxID=2976011 RepID=UPI002E355766|nr:Rad52/Rad22 family DNA repair protein [Streptomyces sp. NBC_00669]
MKRTTNAPAAKAAKRAPKAAPAEAGPAELSGRLTEQQRRVLLGGLSPTRVHQTPEGFSHLQQWDVRRWLIRIFGFGGFDTEILSVTVLRDAAQRAEGGRYRYAAVYRVHQRLTVKDVHGNRLASFDGVATGAAERWTPGEAHDDAVKEADSQALKRAAVNIGDQFGLSLYDSGSFDPVVRWAAPYGTPAEDPPAPARPVQDQPLSASPPAPAPVAEPVSEAEAPQRDYLQEAQDAPDAKTAWAVRREASKAGAERPYLDQISAIARTKPRTARPPDTDSPSGQSGSGPVPVSPDSPDAGADTAPVTGMSAQDSRSQTSEDMSATADTDSGHAPDASGPEADLSVVDGWEAPPYTGVEPGDDWASAPSDGSDPWAVQSAAGSPEAADPDPEHANAVAALRALAAERGIPDLDVEADAWRLYGVPLEDLTADTLRRFRDQLADRPAA